MEELEHGNAVDITGHRAVAGMGMQSRTGELRPANRERDSRVYRVHFTPPPVRRPAGSSEGIWGASERASYDPLRTWLGIAAGALAGVLLVLTGFLLLQLKHGQLRARTAVQDMPAATAASSSDGNSSALPPAPIVGHYPPDFTLNTLEGEPIKLSELRGRPVWVNFWATWCPPCRAEMPEMKQKYARFKAKGLVIVGVDSGESPDTVKQFVTSNGFDWTFVLDSAQTTGQQYFVTGIPTHLFVGRDGVIKAIQVGGLPASMMDQYLDRIINN